MNSPSFSKEENKKYFNGIMKVEDQKLALDQTKSNYNSSISMFNKINSDANSVAQLEGIE